MASNKSEVLRIRIEYGLLNLLKAEAKRECRTMASLVRYLVVQHLKAKENNGGKKA
jgi:hypothetical protein